MNKAIELKINRLANGETFVTSESGNSMLPILKSGEEHWITPCDDWHNLKKDDIVFCRVRGSYVTHKVYAVDNNKGVLIGNNRGHINGWTKTIYGKVSKENPNI